MDGKACCFIGHRKINVTDELKCRLYNEITALIEMGVTRFIFGTRSEFNDLCHEVVTVLKKSCPEIVRVVYNTKSEASVYESDREATEAAWLEIAHRRLKILGYEEIITDDTMYVSGKASYIERNQLMIDASDYCVFYYDRGYIPLQRRLSTRYFMFTSVRSGTAAALDYAIRKKKRVINVFQ